MIKLLNLSQSDRRWLHAAWICLLAGALIAAAAHALAERRWRDERIETVLVFAENC